MTFSAKIYLKSFKKDWEGECNVAIGSPSVTYILVTYYFQSQNTRVTFLDESHDYNK